MKAVVVVVVVVETCKVNRQYNSTLSTELLKVNRKLDPKV